LTDGGDHTRRNFAEKDRQTHTEKYRDRERDRQTHRARREIEREATLCCVFDIVLSSTRADDFQQREMALV